MRVFVFFDLPTITSTDMRAYREFRKLLINEGFIMMQESVYCKLAQNGNMADLIVNGLRRNQPKNGLVQVLRITEKQYAKMEFIVGQHTSDIIDSDERLIIL